MTPLKKKLASSQMFHFAEMIKIDLTAFIKSIICSVKNYMIAATAVLAGSEHFWTKNNITQNRKRFITQPKYMICFSYWMWLILITPFPHKFGPKIATFRGFHKFSLKILDCNTIVISFNWTSCSNIFHWKSTKKTQRNWDYHRHLSEHFYLRPKIEFWNVVTWKASGGLEVLEGSLFIFYIHLKARIGGWKYLNGNFRPICI